MDSDLLTRESSAGGSESTGCETGGSTIHIENIDTKDLEPRKFELGF